eukprot:CAMPEP_0119558638 /NCGR_PEP_ID=MMETSP1352-20130426/10914_1 /TAXON_ID=265584 /ORGANISM="Stauroneis constricta, Strain CCMP1120" /LENGTH=721 /DNA_ID=CAMNT_0007606049 /DNA_START=116 /DNA_END=2281 /DNA_ORIENTATION=+
MIANRLKMQQAGALRFINAAAKCGMRHRQQPAGAMKAFSALASANSWMSSPSTRSANNTSHVHHHHHHHHRRFISTEAEKHFQSLGYLDEEGLTKFDTLHEMQTRACAVYADNDLFGTYNGDTNQVEFETYADFADQVDRCRAVLQDLGVQKYDKVAMISNNRWEWAAIACASYSLSATVVPMYEAQAPSDWIHILNDSEASVVFCATQEIYDRVRDEVLPSAPSVRESLCLNAPEGEPHALATAMASVKSDTKQSLVIEPTPEDLANLIYTSGTTGKPKGVELTHLNFTSNAKSAGRSLTDDPKDLVRESDKSLAFLPWAHSYGETCELWLCMSMGSGIGICRGIPKILEDLQLVRPTVLYAVPTLYKKIYDGVQNLVETSNPIRKRLMRSALALGHEHNQAKLGNRAPLGALERLQYGVLDKIVLSKIRDKFGGRLRHSFVAGAACPLKVLEFMDAIGVPVCEGYGLTETTPIITINTPEQRNVGTVGRAIGGVQVFIIGEDGHPVADGEEGEICCVGPNVMRGYHKNPEATAEVISVAPDGKSRMFHTGDLGRKDADGWVKVTGRIKEQYKLENGKYVVPTPIEEAIGMSRYISQVVLCGANRPHNIALLVPDWKAVRDELGFADGVTDEELAKDDRVGRLLDGEVMRTCAQFKKFEIPTKWALVAPFTVANNMLTQKLSIRRHKVMQAYEDVISHLYGDDLVAVPSADDGCDIKAAA